MTAEYYIWLQLCLGYSCETVGRIISAYGTAKQFYNAPDSEKIARCRLNKVQAEKLHSVPRRKVYAILNDCVKSGINIITPEDRLYPKRLLNIPDPPAVLYVKGRLPDINEIPVISIVGPRRISQYGERCAYVIADTLSSCGFMVVSGGAVGGDKSAHEGALDAGAETIAVLPCGINNDYLKVNAGLRERISHNGCLITEYAPTVGIRKGTFQQRNRILSGIADGVVVVEGGAKSGTLITAHRANEQGRDVFVIPGNPSLPQYEGSNALLAEGAKPLLNINSIIKEYEFIYPSAIHVPNESLKLPQVEAPEQAPCPVTKETPANNYIKAGKFGESSPVKTIDEARLSYNARQIVECILSSQLTEFTVDDIVDRSDFDINDVLSSVTELEIAGVILSLPGGMFKLS